MASWRNDNFLPGYNVTWRGVGEEELDMDLRREIVGKIREYARGTPVSVKVQLTERSADYEQAEDSVGAMMCRNRMFLVAVTQRFTLIMDMHDVNNEIIAMLMTWDQVIRVR